MSRGAQVERCEMKGRWLKRISVLSCIGALGWMGFATGATGQGKPTVAVKKILSARQIESQPFANRFDIKGRRAVVVEVDLSGPNEAVAISSADFGFRYKADGTERTVPCVGLYKGFGIWDLASQGPVTDERNIREDPHQQLLFLVPTDVTQGHLLRTATNEAIEVKTILPAK